jgi:MFS family permease
VFLPFAAGYYLSFLFRTINASISPALASEFGLDAAKTGLLASVYFLVFAGVQIPIGVLLDRYGPRRVQSVLLVLAAGGATLFGTAMGFSELLVARAMIGLGVAASLMAGLKAVIIWFPRERIALVNGCMIMLGSLGAVTATAPTDWVLDWIGWRGLFEVLTFATIAIAAVTYFAVPEDATNEPPSTTSRQQFTLWSVYSDVRFLRVAPLSAACICSSWALQSLWAAPWLADVEGLDRQRLMTQLFIMALGISLGALLLGVLADRLRRRGITAEVLLAAMGGVFIVAELALILRVPMPSLLPWCVVSVMGAATVLSYAMIADYFPRELAARANGALNLAHFGSAFAVQSGIGLVVGQWSPQDGHYPLIAYQFAFGLSAAFQAAALLWFAVPWLRAFSRHLHTSFTRASAQQEGQAKLVAVPVEGPIIDAREAAEW